MQRTYLFVFCLFYLCFVTHQLTPAHSHTQNAIPPRCLQNCTVLARVRGLWAKVNWTKLNWAELCWAGPKLNWNEKKRIGANANANVNVNAHPWRNVGNSTYEQNWPFVQLLCLSELAYFGMTIRWQLGHKSTRHRKGSPTNTNARSQLVHWKQTIDEIVVNNWDFWWEEFESLLIQGELLISEFPNFIFWLMTFL